MGPSTCPHALERTYRQAATAWGWQYVFPTRDVAVAPRSGLTRRHHVDPSVINKAIKVAVRRLTTMERHADAMTVLCLP